MTLSEFFKRFLLILLALLLCAGIWAARSTLLLGFAAAVMAVGVSIPVGWLQRRGWRRGWAVVASLLGVSIIAVLVVLLVLPRVVVELVTLLGTIPDALRSFSATYANLRNSNAFLSAALPVLSPALTSSTGIDPARATAVLNQLLDASLAVAPSFLGGIGVVVAVLINLSFVIFIAIFFLIDPQIYVKVSLFLLPQRYHHRAIFLWNEIYRELKLWISALFLSISITAGLVWLILGVVLGMPNAVVVAVFAGFATFVPNIGAFLPLIPIAIFTLADNPAQFFIMAPVYLVIQLLESNLLTPSIIKIELAIPAGAMMVFQLLATLAFGALGLLLAIPLFVVLLVLVREIYTNDLLGLQQTVIKIGTNARGEFTVLEDTLPAQVAGVAAPAKPAEVFSPGAESEQVIMSSKQG